MQLTISAQNLLGGISAYDSNTLLDVMGDYGYTASVDTWYEKADEGQREHMANKLAKYGYPQNRKLKNDLGDYSLSEIITSLKTHKVTLESIASAWVNHDQEV